MSDDASTLERLLGWGAVAALAVAVLVWPAAWLLSKQSRTLQFIVPADPTLVEVNRATYAADPTGKDEDIVSLYGTPSGEPAAILFADEEHIIRPEEKPQLALLEKGADENPLQVSLVWFIARMTSLGALVAFGAMAGLQILARRRREGADVEGRTTGSVETS